VCQTIDAEEIKAILEEDFQDRVLRFERADAYSAIASERRATGRSVISTAKPLPSPAPTKPRSSLRNRSARLGMFATSESSQRYGWRRAIRWSDQPAARGGWLAAGNAWVRLKPLGARSDIVGSEASASLATKSP